MMEEMGSPSANFDISPILGSKRILGRLRETENKQRKDTLMRLEAACDALDRTGTELSYVNIGRKCLEIYKKGPLASSIANDQGLKEYVKARQDERLISKETGRKPGRVGEIAAKIERIPDPILRAQMRRKHADYLECLKDLSNIRAALKLLTPGLDVDTIIRRYRANPGAPISPTPPPSGPPSMIEEIEGLRALLALFDNAELLGRFGLQNDGKRLKRAKGIQDEFVPMKILAALRALHRSLAGRPAIRFIDMEDMDDD
jgi:hypothetical protein